MQKDRSFDEENNNSLDDDDDDENVINPNLSRDSRSETLNIKVNKLKNQIYYLDINIIILFK